MAIQPDSKKKKPFLTDIQELRRRAREHIEQGPVTSNYEGDKETAIDILNEALATELVCVLRYKNHYYMADGIDSEPVAAEFLEHAQEEELHADQLASRIRQLGGQPDYNPEGLLSRSHSEYQTGQTLVDMITEDLVAERVAVESYREMVRYFAEKDPTTRRLLEEILAKEEEHADDLASLLSQLSPPQKAAG